MIIFEGVTADESWLKASQCLCDKSKTNQHEGRGGKTQEILHAGFSIRNPRERWVISRTPPINPAFAIADVVWILRGRNDSAFLKYWNNQITKFCGDGETFHGAYGHRLRKNFLIDQLNRAYEALHGNPTTRQVVLQIWDPTKDLPNSDGSAISPDIPCNICSILKVRDGKLEWMQIIRSNDLFRGVPYNFIQFTTLQEVMAGWLDLEVGTYNQLSDSLHIYNEDQSKIESSQSVTYYPNTDNIALPKQQSDLAFLKLEKCIEKMIDNDLSKKDLYSNVMVDNIPKGMANLLLMLGAECARRHKWLKITEELIHQCTNSCLNQLWDRWMSRTYKS